MEILNSTDNAPEVTKKEDVNGVENIGPSTENNIDDSIEGNEEESPQKRVACHR